MEKQLVIVQAAFSIDERVIVLRKLKSYTRIWSVEKVIYAINDFRLPFPVTFNQMSWFVISLLMVMLLGNLPPLSLRSEEHTSELQSRGHLVDLLSFPTRRSSDLTGCFFY